MQCRYFTIRSAPEHAREDEARLNAFLSSVHVHSVQVSGATARSAGWSVLVFYEGQSARARRHGLDAAPPLRYYVA
ncbi:MAG: hypothetical protein ACUVS4_10520 [Chloroflexaceae bacterium]